MSTVFGQPFGSNGDQDERDGPRAAAQAQAGPGGPAGPSSNEPRAPGGNESRVPGWYGPGAPGGYGPGGYGGGPSGPGPPRAELSVTPFPFPR